MRSLFTSVDMLHPKRLLDHDGVTSTQQWPTGTHFPCVTRLMLSTPLSLLMGFTFPAKVTHITLHIVTQPGAGRGIQKSNNQIEMIEKCLLNFFLHSAQRFASITSLASDLILKKKLFALLCFWNLINTTDGQIAINNSKLLISWRHSLVRVWHAIGTHVSHTHPLIATGVHSKQTDGQKLFSN